VCVNYYRDCKVRIIANTSGSNAKRVDDTPIAIESTLEEFKDLVLASPHNLVTFLSVATNAYGIDQTTLPYHRKDNLVLIEERTYRALERLCTPYGIRTRHSGDVVRFSKVASSKMSPVQIKTVEESSLELGCINLQQKNLDPITVTAKILKETEVTLGFFSKDHLSPTMMALFLAQVASSSAPFDKKDPADYGYVMECYPLLLWGFACNSRS